MVISRSGTGPVGATRLRDIMFDDIYNWENADPLAPGISGHALAKGATAVAAYDPFKPYLPEYYTSAGGDAGQVRLVGQPVLQPQTGPSRRSPGPTAATRPSSPTTCATPTPSRTSAARAQRHRTWRRSPAWCCRRPAAQVADAHAMRSRLEQSTYAHDLDPFTPARPAG